MTELIDTKQLEIHAELINNAMELAERGAAMAVTGAITAGTELIKAKAIVPHGEWAAWIGTNLNYSQAKVNRYMRIASNSSCVTNLKDAKSISEALRILADDKAEKDPDPPIVPRSERKPADVKVLIPDDSTRVLDDDSEPDTDEVDDDPAPDPPTIRKTAKGSEKVPEAKKPKTAAIVPEIVDDAEESFPKAYLQDPAPRDDSEIVSEWIENTGLTDIVAEVLTARKMLERPIGDKARVAAARSLRKHADQLDPPAEDKIPTRPQLENAIPETWSEQLRTAAKDWAGYKQARKKDKRIQSIRAWEIALNQMTNQPEAIVVQKINNAIASSYEGWNHDSGTGKTQNNGHSNGKADGSCLGANGRPEVQKRKIIYK